MKKSFFRFLSVAALFLLLLRPSIAYEGAKNGLILWGAVIVPTLLPFMICSNVIVSLHAVNLLIFPIKKFLRRFLALSDSGSYIFVSGLLCGYPMGARNCSDFMDDGKITEKEGKYLLAICNHPSPMFLLGYAAAALSPSTPVWILLACVYLPVIPVSIAARSLYGVHSPLSCLPPTGKPSQPFDDSLMDSCEVMVKIGGYIMIFSILSLYIKNISINLPEIKAILLGIVEITTGIKSISEVFSGFSRSLWIGVITAFGGLSGIFQTKSVIKNAGLSIRHYVAWKALHSFLTMLLFILLSQFPVLLQLE